MDRIPGLRGSRVQLRTSVGSAVERARFAPAGQKELVRPETDGNSAGRISQHASPMRKVREALAQGGVAG